MKLKSFKTSSKDLLLEMLTKTLETEEPQILLKSFQNLLCLVFQAEKRRL